MVMVLLIVLILYRTCDGVDNDGDGLVDEGFPDSDGDGIADCVDTETCDGVDNDGDGLIDEGFPILMVMVLLIVLILKL